MPIISIIGVDYQMKRVALYIRVSSDKQAKTGDSLREQEETLLDYVKSQKDMTVHSTYIDDGISGQKLKRDEFQRLMNDVKNNQIDMILFTKLDRWFRSLKHYLNNQDILEKHNVHWIAVSQAYYDTTTAYGRTFINQVMSFAELEAQMTSERLIAVFDNKIKNGEVASGSTPLGYRIEDKRLVPDDDAKIVLDIFRYQDLHGNVSQTVRYLFESYGISRTCTGLRRLFRNQTYIGKNRENDKFCEPIVPEDLFQSVNSQLNTRLTHRTNAKNTYLFTGLIVCDCCNRKMNSAMKGSSRTRKDGTKVKYAKKPEYSCRYAYIYPKCKNKKCLKEWKLEKYLVENLDTIITNQLEQLTANQRKKNQKDTEAVIRRLSKKVDRLKDLYLNELIDINEYKHDRADLLDQMNKLKDTTPDKEEKIKNLNALLHADLFSHYKDLTNLEKAQFWKKIINQIRFDNNRSIVVVFN